MPKIPTPLPRGYSWQRRLIRLRRMQRDRKARRLLAEQRLIKLMDPNADWSRS